MLSPPGGMTKSSGPSTCDAIDAAIDGGGRLDVVLHALQADPDAGETRQRKAVDAVIEHLLDAGRIEHRDHRVDHGELGLMRGGRAFAGMVVAHQRQDAAMLGRAGVIGVAEDVAGAVDARALAVPDAEHAVVLAFAAQLGLLRAPERGRGEVLVEARMEDDIALADQQIARAGRRLPGRRSASRDSR